MTGIATVVRLGLEVGIFLAILSRVGLSARQKCCCDYCRTLASIGDAELAATANLPDSFIDLN